MQRFVWPLVFLLGCTSSSAPPVSSSAPDASVDSADAAAPAQYPTDHLGWLQRTPTKPGDVIPNVVGRALKPDGAFADVPFSTFYDPESRTHSVVIIVAGWAVGGLTADTTKALIGAHVDGVLVVAVLGDGRMGTATDDTARAFAAETGAPYVFVDPRNAMLGNVFDGASSPFVIALDARTMEIVYANAGAVPAELAKEMHDDVLSRPPAY